MSSPLENEPPSSVVADELNGESKDDPKFESIAAKS